ncbi:MAG: DUF4386 domain-containing protein [Clostridiales bacterium]|jgi:hypothetical protein|nr:DUF4386 domain-containing protein [Clostridiales bacterium]
MENKPNLNSSKLSLNKTAIAAAIALFANIILAGAAYGGILPGIISKGDGAAILSNIIVSEQQFRIAICLLILNVIADIVVFWALYSFLKPVNKSISLLAALFGAMHAVVALAATNNLIDLLHMADRSISGFNSEIFYAQTITAIDAFNWAWQAGMVMFSIHLLLRGWLLLKAGYLKKMLGIVMLIVAAGYLIDGFGRILISGYNSSLVSVYVGWLEVVLPIWLLAKGRKIVSPLSIVD